MNTTTHNPLNILKIILKYKYYFIVSFLIVTPGIFSVGMFLPRIYRTSTTILVEPQKVPSHFVQSLVTVPIEMRLKTISQQIMSRSRLLKVTRELNLLPNNASPIATENAIIQMQEQIEIEVKGTSSFQIAYKGTDPKMVMDVANKLASLFIEENLKVSERIASTTTKFLSEELEKGQQELEDQEKKLQIFKQEHMGELPSQLEANLRALDRIQMDLQVYNKSIREMEEKKSLIQKQLLEENPYQNKQMLEAQRDPLVDQLNQLKAQLEVLKTRYSDKWPKIKQLKEEITGMEEKTKEEAETGKPTAENSPNDVPALVENQLIRSLKQELERADFEIKESGEVRNKLTRELNGYKARVENTPRIEQELVSLTRDYEITKDKYQSLLNKKLEAKLSESLETKQKGETFKVLDAAEMPLLPFKPDFKKIGIAAVFAGLALGACWVWVKEMLDHSIRCADEVKELFGLPVLGVVSNIITDYDSRRKKIKQVLLISCLAVYLCSLFFLVKERKTIERRFSFGEAFQSGRD
ncbi:MAG: hypothetical protein HZA78_11900 [Candidatus Schekmanbacteria bacterium]|nr:hypothetical protein [Candidatus Schekmanbacteria bacterium]